MHIGCIAGEHAPGNRLTAKLANLADSQFFVCVLMRSLRGELQPVAAEVGAARMHCTRAAALNDWATEALLGAPLGGGSDGRFGSRSPAGGAEASCLVARLGTP